MSEVISNITLFYNEINKKLMFSNKWHDINNIDVRSEILGYLKSQHSLHKKKLLLPALLANKSKC